jgi:hypothetical protein
MIARFFSFLIIILASSCIKAEKENALLKNALEELAADLRRHNQEFIYKIQKNVYEEPKYVNILNESNRIDSLRKRLEGRILESRSLPIHRQIDSIYSIYQILLVEFSFQPTKYLGKEMFYSAQNQGVLIEYSKYQILKFTKELQAFLIQKCGSDDCYDYEPFFEEAEIINGKKENELIVVRDFWRTGIKIDSIKYSGKKILLNPKFEILPIKAILKFDVPLKPGTYKVSGKWMHSNPCF